MSRQAGERAERVAQRILERRGLETICRNYHCRWGELDLVMRDGDVLVVVEVRARGDSRYGPPEQSVGPAKRARLIAAARHLLAARPRLAVSPLRFDIVALTPAGGDYTFRWLKDAFRH